MIQQPSQDIQQPNPDEAAAVLSFATHLSQQLMPKQPQTQEKGATSDVQQSGGENTIKEPQIDLEANNKEMEKMMISKIEELKKEIQGTIKEEISGIKDSIQEALQEDGK